MTEYISTKTVARRLEVQPRVVMKWDKEGMPSYKFRRMRRFIWDEVVEWLSDQDNPPASATS